MARNTLRMYLSLSLSRGYLSTLFFPTLSSLPPPSFFTLAPPWKEESGDLIAFGSGPGHEQSYQKLVGRSQLSLQESTVLFHPVDTARELVTRLVVNSVPSGTGAGEGREGFRFPLFSFSSVYRLRYYFFSFSLLSFFFPVLPHAPLFRAFSAAVIPYCLAAVGDRKGVTPPPLEVPLPRKGGEEFFF